MRVETDQGYDSKFFLGKLNLFQKVLVRRVMLHDFLLAGKRMRLWQRTGESYGHVLMKALGYAMFVGEFPQMEIETKVGLRYKPDLVARAPGGKFLFWGEAGENSFRKTLWLLKHARVERLVLFKIGTAGAEQFVGQLREAVPAKYRAGDKLLLVNFTVEIARLTAGKQIEKVSSDWFSKMIV